MESLTGLFHALLKMVFTTFVLGVQHKRDNADKKLSSSSAVPLGKAPIEIFSLVRGKQQMGPNSIPDAVVPSD